MQEVVCLLRQRVQELRYFAQAAIHTKDLNLSFMKLDFNQQIRTHQQKKILSTFQENTSSICISQQVRDQLTAIVNQYASMSSDSSLNDRKLHAENDLQSYTSQVVQVCRAVFDEVRTKIITQSVQGIKSHDAFPLTFKRFEVLLQDYSIKVGLFNEIEPIQPDKLNRSLPDLLLECTKANNKTINSMKQYALQYRSYLSRLERRKAKKLALEAAQKKAEAAKNVKNKTPFKKITLENSLNAKCRQSRKEKIPLPQALKKIEFPFLPSAKTEQPLYLASIHKKATKKIYTIPSQHISHNPSIYLHNASEQKAPEGQSNSLACDKLDIIEVPIQRIHLTIIKQKIKEEMRRREERGFYQSNFFFNDEAVKRGVDERLPFSNKRFG